MSIESIKLSLLEWLAQIEDETILTQLKKIRDEVELAQYEKELKKPFTEKELITRTKKSEDDYLKDRVKTIDQAVSISRLGIENARI